MDDCTTSSFFDCFYMSYSAMSAKEGWYTLGMAGVKMFRVVPFTSTLPSPLHW